MVETDAEFEAIPIRPADELTLTLDGWLMSDDLGMEALRGNMSERAAGVVAAGCDVALHCSGEMEEMLAVAAAVPRMSQEGEARLARAMAGAMNEQDGPDYAEAAAKRDALLALA